MKKLLFMVILLMTSLLQQAIAQDRTISGRVTDRANGQGLPGVTVLVKGTTVGASTNSDGTYSLSVPASATTLSFTSIGYISVDRPIGGATTIDVGLGADTKTLGEVVVTALGVERTRNSLAYSATTVEGENITKARNPNFINGLSGKVAGLDIKQSNTLGGSSNVVIRGNKSLFGNNQALFVVDGVPISNASTNTTTAASSASGVPQATGGGGYDYGNAGADINPDDIATMTVLKGAAATALYGERASNGVILITTKKGRKGLGVTINSGVTLGRYDKSTFIKYQDKYGAGYGKAYGPKGNEYFNRLDNGSEVVPTQEDASYGGPFDGHLVYQWDAFSPGSPNFGKATPWVAAANGPSTFFEDAVSTLNSISVDGGNDQGFFKLGYNNNVDKGILPNSKITKNMVNFAGSLNLTPKLTTSASVNYTRIDGLGRYGTGYGSENVMTNFRQWWQTNVDVKAQKEAYERTNQNATWNYADVTTGDLSPIYWNNPYFVRYQNYENDNRNRIFGNVMATYKFTDWFNVLGRVTADTYDELQEERSNVGSTQSSYPSYYSRFNRTSREYNYDLIGNFNKNITEDFSFTGLIGANMRRQAFSSIRAITNGGLVAPGVYSLANSLSPIEAPIEIEQRVGVDGIFASATFGYKQMVFLDLTGRRDKSTTLPTKSNTFFYPSAALGFVFSEALKEKTPWLSYGKLRGNYAEVGQGAIPLAVYDTYRQGAPFGSAPIFSVAGTKNNPDLKPERTTSSEVGIDMAFLQSRVGFDFTVYKQNTKDQIIPLNLSTATGQNSRYVNSGEVQNKGVEITAFVSPVKTDNFNWTVNLNWSKNQNKVLSLFSDLDNIVIANYQGGVTSNASVGQAFGVLRGSGFVYDANGQKVVNPATGYYQQATNAIIGDVNPKWKGGISNTVSYKSVSFNFLIDIKKGGSVFSLDRYYGLATGLTPETAGLNDLGNPSRLPIAEGGGVILDGVNPDGTKNTKRVSNTNFGLYGYRRNPAEAFVYDAGFVKLREAARSCADLLAAQSMAVESCCCKRYRFVACRTELMDHQQAFA
ncbi:SusC/RagA family TonB-linked outer membrane protein [Hymenobacter chitinivorans]|uniref:TonB-linked SusC/RagA family outer membrane protein n=1 Tax=Hymenobacter chitinivorans DSM 11115 TaxID=1121954 RepID=A0A2M9AQF5_9BACT|nr:SusC/RagA family TonB-linked outer membrane protein [Hymenobacter chitinivorans]PJJ47926.1 TonB-linked SusC/RagA family outer membrane protein [Hymenobacter chitinivorans DSM 11115]